MKINKLYLILSFLLGTLCASDDYFYQKGKKVYITPLESVQLYSVSESSSKNNIRYVKTQYNKTLGYYDEILLKTTADIETILKNYNLNLTKKLTSTIYLVRVKDKDMILDISNRMYEDKDIQFSHPNFMKKVDKR